MRKTSSWPSSRKALEFADQSVIDEAEADYRLAGMGTTLTMAFCVGADLYIVHAGDSRAYLSRGGVMEQVTSDHTLVQMLVTGGMITPEAAKSHHRRNVVTNVIGGPSPGVHAEIHKVRLEDGDVPPPLHRWPDRARSMIHRSPRSSPRNPTPRPPLAD